MTLYELIYIIGCGVAFLMCLAGAAKYANDSVIDSLGGIIISLLGAPLSWAVPIWYIGLRYFEEKRVGIKIKSMGNSNVVILEDEQDV